MFNILVNKACKQGEAVDVVLNKADAMCRNKSVQKYRPFENAEIR